MDVRIETRPDVDVVYTYALGPYPESAPKAWQALCAWQVKNNLLEKSVQGIGFGMDHPATKPAKLIRYVAAIELSEGARQDEAANIDVMTIPGGVYAVHCMRGAYSNMSATFQRLQTEWLPASGRAIDYSRPFLEIYLNDPGKVAEADLQTDICLPLQADR